jgi:hypothetical protein
MVDSADLPSLRASTTVTATIKAVMVAMNPKSMRSKRELYDIVPPVVLPGALVLPDEEWPRSKHLA